MIDVKELRRLAEAAYPGPWQAHVGEIAKGVMVGSLDHFAHYGCCSKEDAKFISACNPATVLELLSALELSKADAALLRAVERVWKEERARLLEVLKAADKVLKSKIFDETPFASYSEAWSNMRERVEACRDIEGEDGQ